MDAGQGPRVGESGRDEHEPDADARPIRGDLVVSLDRVRSQARRYRVTAGSELVRLVVHGALHLCGHDHARAAERQRMRTRERSAMRLARASVRAVDDTLGRAAVRSRA